jgi:hypothetical protein
MFSMFARPLCTASSSIIRYVHKFFPLCSLNNISSFLSSGLTYNNNNKSSFVRTFVYSICRAHKCIRKYIYIYTKKMCGRNIIIHWRNTRGKKGIGKSRCHPVKRFIFSFQAFSFSRKMLCILFFVLFFFCFFAFPLLLPLRHSFMPHFLHVLCVCCSLFFLRQMSGVPALALMLLSR